jgi:hypothetical protein
MANYTDFQIKTITKLIQDNFRDSLMSKYPYAPGYNGDAYGNGRNPKYRGEGNKRSSGSLYNSINVEWSESEGAFLLYMNDYYTNVDEGRKPGKYVPISPLEKWASLTLGLSGKEAKGAAFGISKNIYKFGIAPTYFYTEAVETMDTKLDGPMGDMIGVDIEEILDNIMDKIIEK